MSGLLRRPIILSLIILFLVTAIIHSLSGDVGVSGLPSFITRQHTSRWKNLPQRYPVTSYIALPTGKPSPIPPIQHHFQPETPNRRQEREKRLKAVKESFLHSWNGYKQHAWLQDEVTPLSGGVKNGFGGWGATLVDSLDTLWIMGLKKEFASAMHALKKIDFSTSAVHSINVFETTIRYLGGLLSAYDISDGKYPELLQKAIDLGDMLYVAFDTPNRMPITQWDWENALNNGEQDTPRMVLLAEYGSLSLEFTRLTQLTGDLKYYDAVQRVADVLEERQNATRIPGLWPIMLDPKDMDFYKDRTFTMGAMADSHYEYLPKQHLMLGGQTNQNRDMYQLALAVAKQKMFFKPINPDNQQLLIPGTLVGNSAKTMKLRTESQHLTCFAGGMVGLAAKVFDDEQELDTARQLVDGCLWAYDSMPSGIMPEIFNAQACATENCTWSDTEWYEGVRKQDAHSLSPTLSLEDYAKTIIERKNLVPGFTRINDPRYILRPEAIESVFVMYRITGDPVLQDRAWKMFKSIEKHARTDIAYAAINDVSVSETDHFDSMESFWTAETLKYFYLIFSEPDVVSLDEYILNTEAHPLLRTYT